jgi:hypothetical protein
MNQGAQWYCLTEKLEVPNLMGLSLETKKKS